MKCYLIRHGKTHGNLEKRYIGSRTDEPLCEEGICQLGPVSDIPKEDLLFVSPMKRAIQTAQILFPDKEEILIDEFAETDFGRFEGKNYKELQDDPEYQKWIDSGGTAAFPDGEDPEDFRKRSFAGFEKAAQTAARKGCEQFWIVAHGGTVMSVMSRLTGKEYFDFMINCGEGYEVTFVIRDDGYDMVSYDRFCNRDRA